VSYCVKKVYTYNSYDGTYYSREIIDSVANKQIFIKISNDEFEEGEEGFTVIQTKTDKNGNYEIEIPVPEEGANVRIQAESFVDSCRYVRLNDSGEEDSYRAEEGVFSTAEETIKLFPNDIKFYDLEYEFNRYENNEVVQSVTVKVGLGSFKGYDDICFKSQKGIVVTLTDAYGKGAWSSTTDINGIAEFSIPESISTVLVTVNQVPYTPFYYYYDYGRYYNISRGEWFQYSDYQRGIISSQSKSIYYSGEIKVKMVYVTSEEISANYGYYWNEYEWYNVDFE
ncbi:MAG: hypothetical protein K2I90_06775, partial [Odoribacter sp.]|nr:hypothetical protein [Odoribacter sp.]